jgi:hypothetical protein
MTDFTGRVVVITGAAGEQADVGNSPYSPL